MLTAWIGDASDGASPGVRVPGDTSPGVLAAQLALTVDDPERITAAPSRPADRRSR
jgi:hypothetical protein